jgi:hypothetical protein
LSFGGRLSQVKQRLDLKVSDLGTVPLKNIVEPVHVYSLEVGQPTSSVALGSQAKSLDSKPRLLAAFAALLILVAASGWYMLGGRLTKPAQAAHLSVVVLPFANLSGDPSQDYFADWITENLTTELSRIRDNAPDLHWLAVSAGTLSGISGSQRTGDDLPFPARDSLRG